MVKVFVYGTLKKGFPNHYKIQNEKFIGEAYLHNYDMYSLQYCPFIFKGKGKIKGELYEINEKTIPKIDLLESFYTKKVEDVFLSNGKKYNALCYVFEEKQVIKLFKPILKEIKIPDNIW